MTRLLSFARAGAAAGGDSAHGAVRTDAAPIAFDPIDPFYDQRASDSINSIGSSVARHGRPARVCVHR